MGGFLGTVAFVAGLFFLLPSVVYYVLPQRANYDDKRKLFLLTIWSVHAVLVLPWFLAAIYTGVQPFWFYDKVKETFISADLYDAIVFGYFYFIFYLSIYVGPLLLIERKLGKKIDRTAYAVVVIWFWLTISTFGQFITEMQSIARKLFPLGNDVLSQWVLLGYIILTTSASWLVRKLYSEYKTVVTKKADNNQPEKNQA